MFRITIEHVPTGESVTYEIQTLAQLAFVLAGDHEDIDSLPTDFNDPRQRAIASMPEDVRHSPYLPIVLNEFEGRPLTPHSIQAIVEGVRYKERRDAGLR